MAEKKLKRSRKNKMIAGIIGGMAERYEMDATVLRIIYVLVSPSVTIVVRSVKTDLRGSWSVKWLFTAPS